MSISGRALASSWSFAVRTLPRQRKVGLDADGHVDLVAVEPAALPMAPSGVRVAVALALRAVLRQVALAVRVGGHVGAVDGDIPAHVGKVPAKARGHASDARVEHAAVGAELRA